MLNTHVFSPSSALDKDLFELMLLNAAVSSTPSYIADVTTDPANFERYCAEGRMRAEANARMRGKEWRREDQLTPGQTLTIDELGRVGEGSIEEMLGLDVAAVLADSTDKRPDKTLASIKFDVKAANIVFFPGFVVELRSVLEEPSHCTPPYRAPSSRIR